MPFLLPGRAKVYVQYKLYSLACQLKRSDMQGYPFELPLTEYPPLTPLVTDTASPQQRIPIYYIHALSQPFCPNSECKCHRQQQEVRRLLDNIVEGIMTLRDAANLIDEERREGDA